MSTNETKAAPITPIPADYWKLRAIESDRARVVEAAQRDLAAVDAKRLAIYEALGMSPRTAYRLNDDTLSIEPVEE